MPDKDAVDFIYGGKLVSLCDLAYIEVRSRTPMSVVQWGQSSPGKDTDCHSVINT